MSLCREVAHPFPKDRTVLLSSGALLAALGPTHLLDDTGELLGSSAPVQQLKTLCRGMVGHRVERGLSITILACLAPGKSVDPLVFPSLRRAPSQLVWQNFLGTNSRAVLGRDWAPTAPSLRGNQYPRASRGAWGRYSQHRVFRTVIPPTWSKTYMRKQLSQRRGGKVYL